MEMKHRTGSGFDADAIDHTTAADLAAVGSDKWTRYPGCIGAFIAEMDYGLAPCIQEAIDNACDHCKLGYIPEPWKQRVAAACAGWQRSHYGWDVDPSIIRVVPDVLEAYELFLRELVGAGNSVIVPTPAYMPFLSVPKLYDVDVIEIEMLQSGDAETGEAQWVFDFDAIERAFAAGCHAFVLCNPHNPAGRVWTPEELRRIGDICLRRDILVVADEIHCELVMPGFRHTPFASLSEEFARRSVTCASPSKAFNLAGVQVANIFAADAGIRERIARSLEINETGMISPFAIEALTAAYTDGAEWLDALNGYLWENYLFLRDYFARHLPQFPVLPLEGTYLVWADCRAAGLTSDALTRRLLDEGRLHVNSGSMYGAAGEGFIRLNIACPRKLLAEGLDRLKRVLTA